MTEQSLRKKEVLFEGFSLVAILVLFIIIVSTSLTTDTAILLVILGFSPTLITIILAILIYEETIHKRVFLWFVPFVLAGVFYFVATSPVFSSSSLSIGSLTGINLIFSIAYLAVFFSLVQFLVPTPKAKKTTAPQQQIVEVQSPKSIVEFLTSIEDKSKALNFAIGRVYSKFHGGTKEMRDRINVPAEWYNEFSQSMEGDKIIDKKKALNTVEMITGRLKLLEQTELSVWGEQVDKLKNLKRDSAGQSTILDVLRENDKDPVENYYKGALEFCDMLLQKLG